MKMEITAVFYPKTRAEWRDWLSTHHQSGKTEVWVQTFKKATGRPSLPYDDLVEECLCFGWIDGVVNKYEEDSMVQRITPRRKKTFLSELNRQRIWKLQRAGLMTQAGIDPIAEQIGNPSDPLVIPEWIELRLKANADIWSNFQKFSPFYQRLKVGWIQETGKLRREEAEKRLNYLLKMTAAGKMYGTQPLKDVP
jgi:uncharacterized protein YdeI (YjbR/CyaY-like superfamily)